MRSSACTTWRGTSSRRSSSIRDAVPPFTALLVSGGHTLLVDVEAWGRYRLLGRTRDDAAGEAFDKVAKLLGLPYPGGPQIERLARDGDPAALSLRASDAPPRPAARRCRLLRRVVQRAQDRGAERDESGRRELPIARTSLAGFRMRSSRRSSRRRSAPCAHIRRTRVVLGGGVACNATLAEAMRARVAELGAEVFAPSARLATDNAAMIARAGLFRFERGERASLDLNAYASLPLPGLIAA